VAVLPAASVAEQFTVVVPSAKVLPDAGMHVTAGLVGFASVAVALNITTAPAGPIASAVILAGRLSVGGTESQVTTVADSATLSLGSRTPPLTFVPVESTRSWPLAPPRVEAVNVTRIVTVWELMVPFAWLVQLDGRTIVPDPDALKAEGVIEPTDT
jgi:hypothetical protein